MTLREVKDGIAKCYGYPAWCDLDFQAIDERCGCTRAPYAEQRLWEEVAREYARQKVNEQRDKLATYLSSHFNVRNVERPDLKD